MANEHTAKWKLYTTQARKLVAQVHLLPLLPTHAAAALQGPVYWGQTLAAASIKRYAAERLICYMCKATKLNSVCPNMPCDE